jgi:hypothetical protein
MTDDPESPCVQYVPLVHTLGPGFVDVVVVVVGDGVVVGAAPAAPAAPPVAPQPSQGMASPPMGVEAEVAVVLFGGEAGAPAALGRSASGEEDTSSPAAHASSAAPNTTTPAKTVRFIITSSLVDSYLAVRADLPSSPRTQIVASSRYARGTRS